MNNKYELKMNSILQKYFNYEIDKYHLDKYEYIINVLKSLLHTKCRKKFAIWGAGEHTNQMFKLFYEILDNALYVIDNNAELEGKESNGFKIAKFNSIDVNEIECIILSTFSSRKTIESQINQLNKNIEVIDLYDYLESKHNIFLDTPFYIKRNIYLDIDITCREIEKSDDFTLKYTEVKKIIYLYLSIRDILNANRYIDKYIDQFSNEKRLELSNLKIDVQNLVDELKLDIMGRKGKDLLFLFYDSIRAKDIYNELSKMPYLKSTLKNSVYFTNAFSTGVVTNESIPSMFSGKMPFYNKLYTRNCLKQEECPFLCEAVKQSYKIKIYSEKIWHMVDGENIEFEIFKDYASYNLWKSLTDLASSDKEKCLHIVYFLREPHPPHICGKHSKRIVGHVTLFTNTDSVNQSQAEFSNQYYECLKYLDEQLKFYEEIMSNNLNEIIFSDHGQVVEQAKKSVQDIGILASWHDDKYHVPIVLKHNKIKPQKYENLFSTLNFNELIIGMLNDNLCVKESSIVEMNFSRTQNSTIRQNYINCKCEDYIDGYKVFRNKDYKVAVTGNGKIKAYFMENEEKEIVDETLKKEVIKYFSKIVDLSIPKLDEKNELYKNVF